MTTQQKLFFSLSVLTFPLQKYYLRLQAPVFGDKGKSSTGDDGGQERADEDGFETNLKINFDKCFELEFPVQVQKYNDKWGAVKKLRN